MNKKLTTFITALLFCCLAIADAETVFPYQLDDVFWNNLYYDGVKVDITTPPPNHSMIENNTEPNKEDVNHKYAWKLYFVTEGKHELTWKGISFSPLESPPNAHIWSGWLSTKYMDWWELYFTEMYYAGGIENPLANPVYNELWSELSYKGSLIDPYTMPPDYDATRDLWWKDREQIGYHWLWEYYLCDKSFEENFQGDKLCWHGIEFDIHDQPPNYVWDEDPWISSRERRGYLEYWGAFLISGNKTEY